MEPQDIINVITHNPGFKLVGYTNSSAVTRDYLCRCTGYQEYLALLRHSLKQLPLVYEQLRKDRPEFEDSIAEKGLLALTESLHKRVQTEEQGGGTPRASNEALEAVTGTGNLFRSAGGIVLMRVLAKPDPVVDDVAPRMSMSTLTWFKALLQDRLPMGLYQHRFNLYEGKIQDIVPATLPDELLHTYS